ncbi:MAG: hypothetical protein LBK99_12575 [Opitutaceae bacterium]|nr:hypothetical protein [Opitutaceae bacterium]
MSITHARQLEEAFAILALCEDRDTTNKTFRNAGKYPVGVFAALRIEILLRKRQRTHGTIHLSCRSDFFGIGRWAVVLRENSWEYFSR